MSSRVVVVAGNRLEARYWAQDNHIAEHHVIYVPRGPNGALALQGLSADVRVEYVGTWQQREDLGRIQQQLDIIRAVPTPRKPLAVKPTLCRAVLYRSKTGRYTLAADVIGVQSSLYAPGVEAGHVPELDSDTHVHLLVKTPGRPGFRLPNTDPSIAADPMGGTYVEYNIPFWQPPTDWMWPHENCRDDSLDDQPAGTWTWPPRA